MRWMGQARDEEVDTPSRGKGGDIPGHGRGDRHTGQRMRKQTQRYEGKKVEKSGYGWGGRCAGPVTRRWTHQAKKKQVRIPSQG